MIGVLEEVEYAMPVMRAARLFNVPRSTLRNRVAGNMKHDTNPGLTTKLMLRKQTGQHFS